MLVLTDQTGHTLWLTAPARRIVSLVPSQTELLYDLGLRDDVVGITKFCVHPEAWFHTKTRIGGTKNPHLDKIRELKPDLVVANKEENMEAHVRELQQEFAVYTSEVSGIQENNEMIRHIGLLTNKNEEAKGMIKTIETLYSNNPDTPEKRRNSLYLIWRQPWLSVGGDTFIHYMMKQAGFGNCQQHLTRYPEIDLAGWQGPHPDYILLSSEPYPFREKHIPELQSFFPSSKILLVDGEYFSWYGSRVIKAKKYFESLKTV